MGHLYLVPTPVGNLEDMTLRAIRILQEADLILAEDTRTSGKLLHHYQITTPMQSHHMHNEHHTVAKWVEKLQEGKTIALITDAGTPAISDPGFLLTRACVQANIKVECLPGATAFVPALVQSGLPNERFVFEGFLPEKKGRQTRWLQLATETRTLILYVSPHKIVKTLEEVVQYFGPERPVSLSREISKLHEETLRGTATEVLAITQQRTLKGEMVLVIGGNNPKGE
ncbi:MAG: 16S rRNA (cytidine(1402)-2'-O)-methyltransferase [Flavobacterium sp. BFFFF2]|nr:MAG: 16S rRNA (cytidine(1402)-2'-O)-methyltransferase [Flavobacterium sp. BFFFF2]